VDTSSTATPRIHWVTYEPPTTGCAQASMCPHCGGRIDAATTVESQPLSGPVVEEPGPGTAVEAAAVRAVFAGHCCCW
jgi:hypothetical protein